MLQILRHERTRWVVPWLLVQPITMLEMVPRTSDLVRYNQVAKSTHTERCRCRCTASCQCSYWRKQLASLITAPLTFHKACITGSFTVDVVQQLHSHKGTLQALWSLGKSAQALQRLTQEDAQFSWRLFSRTAESKVQTWERKTYPSRP